MPKVTSLEKANLNVGNKMSYPEIYEAEMWSYRKDYIYAAIESLKVGLEYAQICLEDYGGSTEHKNRRDKTWAWKMESDIARMTEALWWLQNKCSKPVEAELE